ncbi:MAG: RraA family protein [Acidobacteria bacterium]|nr:RraA family protein [Acidobacteriota bacterium]
MFREIEETLYTAVLSDALDEIGHHNCAMRERMRPINLNTRFAGWARTIQFQDMHYISDDPYHLEIEAMDSILPGEVVVVSTYESVRNAPWGELLSTAAIARGSRGAVVDGLIRDVRTIQNLGFQIFASGIKPVDSRGRGQVIDYNVPVECAGVLVKPGDLVVADYDGVVVVPLEVVGSVLQKARAKVSMENKSRAELKNGAYLADVYAKYGVL